MAIEKRNARMTATVLPDFPRRFDCINDPPLRFGSTACFASADFCLVKTYGESM
jgi:hypothetical protein